MQDSQMASQDQDSQTFHHLSASPLPSPSQATPASTSLESGFSHEDGPESSTFRDPYDCTPCRVIGSITFAGSGAYILHQGRVQLRHEHARYMRDLPRVRSLYLLRKSAFGVVGYGLIAAGLYRWIM